LEKSSQLISLADFQSICFARAICRVCCAHSRVFGDEFFEFMAMANVDRVLIAQMAMRLGECPRFWNKEVVMALKLIEFDFLFNFRTSHARHDEKRTPSASTSNRQQQQLQQQRRWSSDTPKSSQYK
jgi:hypothetical protein